MVAYEGNLHKQTPMTIRVDDLPFDNTQLMLQRLLPMLKEGNRVLFLTARGEGDNVVQRIRVMVSRFRKQFRAKGRRQRHFKLHHSIHPHTERGQRFDAVVMWESRNTKHEMMEILEDMLTNG